MSAPRSPLRSAGASRRARRRSRLSTGLACALLALALGACDPASLYGPLTGQWTKQTTGYPIAAKPAVGGGNVYVGSWDGREYAFNESSGAVTWSTYLGVTSADCGGTVYTQGVTSSPWLQNRSAYLGGGGATWDALDSSTGSVLWSVPTGDNSLTGGHYNWSSPVVYNGFAYVGIASFCDSPLVQGELLRVDLATHAIGGAFKVVPDGQTGGTIWTNPVVDPATNTVFVATGNAGGANQPYAQSILALDATTLAVKSHWSLPAGDPTVDPDFGTTPVLFTGAGGRPMVAVTNKNGMLYGFSRADLSAGPVWQTRIAVSVNVCDACGGSFSTGLFDGTRLYYAAGATTVAGRTAGGSIRAFDPATGAVLWQHALPAQVYGALAGANGMVVVPSSDGGLYVVRATDGTVLYANGLTGASGASAIFGASTIADGSLFIGTTDGVVHAFRFPASAGSVLGARPAARSAAARAARSAPACSGRGGRVLRADCRLTIPAGARCVRLGELPVAVGAVSLDRLALRETGPSAGGAATVRLFTDGSCAGAPVLGLGLRHGRGAHRFAHPPALPPGAVASLAASHAITLDLRLAGHRRAAPVRPGRLRPPIGPRG